MKTDLSAAFIRSILDYDPIAGTFVWKVNAAPRCPAGTPTGLPRSSNSYSLIMIGGVNYYAHRLAWLHYKGQWPKHFIDHIDGNKRNNAIDNLRECNNSQNKCNMAKRCDNSTGFKGVYYNKRNNNFRAGIQIHGKKISLGSYKTPEEAYAAYCIAAAELHGDFHKV